MNLQGYRDTFYTYSGKASDITRQLAFAGIALIWLFKSNIGGQFTLPRKLVTPSIFIVCTLASDLLHYLAGSLIWRSFYRSKEELGLEEEIHITHSPLWEKPLWILFCIKVVFVLLAYVCIFFFLLHNLAFR